MGNPSWPKNPQKMELSDLKYIVFLLDCKHKQHDGKVCSSLEDARDFVHTYQEEKWATQFIIGTFLLEPGARDMNIQLIEPYGFKADKKHTNQLDLFKTN
jgi:hypothetical protein